MAHQQRNASFRQLILPALFIILSIIASSHAASLPTALQTNNHPSTDKETKIYKVKINNLVDKHLSNIRRMLSPLDPAPMKDKLFKMILFRYSLTKGWMQNLALAKRGGDCYFIYKEGQFIAEFNAFWDDLAFDYRYEYKSGIVKKVGDLHGQMYSLHMNIAYKYDFATKKWTLDKFEFTDVSDLKISTEGNILDKLGKVFVKLLTKLLKDLLLDLIEDCFKEMLEGSLEPGAFIAQPEKLFTDEFNLDKNLFLDSVKYE